MPIQKLKLSVNTNQPPNQDATSTSNKIKLCIYSYKNIYCYNKLLLTIFCNDQTYFRETDTIKLFLFSDTDKYDKVSFEDLVKKYNSDIKNHIDARYKVDTVCFLSLDTINKLIKVSKVHNADNIYQKLCSILNDIRTRENYLLQSSDDNVKDNVDNTDTIVNNVKDNVDAIVNNTKSTDYMTKFTLNNLLEYNGLNILTFYDENLENFWFRGKDVAEILRYVNTEKAIRMHVHNDDKISCKVLHRLLKSTSVDSQPKLGCLEKIDSKAYFINESGLYSLILKSKQENALAFQRWITKEVLPSIRKYGSYTQNTNKIQFKSFYDNNMLAKYDDKNVLYIGYIGDYNEEQIFKFGKTISLFRRDFKEHQKFFDKFEMLHVIECDNKDIVEDKFKKELQAKHLYRQIKIKDKTHGELFTVSDVIPFEKVKEMLNELVATYPLTAVKENSAIIDSLNQQIKLYKSMLAKYEEELVFVKSTFTKPHDDLNMLKQTLEEYKNKNEILKDQLNQYFKNIKLFLSNETQLDMLRKYVSIFNQVPDLDDEHFYDAYLKFKDKIVQDENNILYVKF